MNDEVAFWSLGDDWYHRCSNCKTVQHFYYCITSDGKNNFLHKCPVCGYKMKWENEELNKKSVPDLAY